MPTPRAIVIAGPNGAGKTTFAREFLPREAGVSTFINADLIAAGLSPFRPEAAAVRAMRLMAEAIEESVEARRDFAIETTLAGRSYLGLIERWRAAGYRVKIVFLRLPNAGVAVERVCLRVAQGGHHVPEEVVRRRFEQGWRQFIESFRPLADAWQVYDANQKPVVLVDAGHRGGRVMEYASEDADLAGAEAAMRRASERACADARRFGTPLAFWRDGRVVLVSPDDVDGPPVAELLSTRATPQR